MMKSVLFANIGNRDLGHSSIPLFNNSIENILRQSEELSKNKEEINKLDAILLDPVIREIIKSGSLEKIYLFGTLQVPPHRQDTYYIAKIVRDILILKYGFNNDTIKITEIENNPADYDDMYKFFGDFLDSKVFDDISDVYVSLTGGTPAQNFSLLVQSMYKVKNKAIAVYLSKGSTEPEFLKIGHEISKSVMSQRMEELKERHFLGLASELSEKYDLIHPNEIKFMQALACKNSFDFETSMKILEGIKDNLKPSRKIEAEKLIERMKLLTAKEIEPFSELYFKRYLIQIEELYESTMIKWNNGEYLDFLGRLYRFQEASLRFLLEKELNVDTSDKEKFMNFIKNNSGLYEFLKQKYSDMKNSRHTFILIMEYHKEANPYFKTVSRISQRIEKLIQIRNGTIMGHGFSGVSKKLIENCYNEGGILRNPLDDCKKILDSIKNRQTSTAKNDRS